MSSGDPGTISADTADEERERSSIHRTGGDGVRAAYRRLLERWPVPAEHVVVPTRHGETFVVSCGAGGRAAGGAGARVRVERGDVAGVVAEWAGEFRVHAVDVPGEPGLSAETRLPPDGPEHPEWLDEVPDAVGVGAAAFVGCRSAGCPPPTTRSGPGGCGGWCW